ITGAGSVGDDPSTTDCNENALLLRLPDGTIKYRQINTVDPSGINGQSVYNGTDSVDRVYGGNDNDTFWGQDGNDIHEGGFGDDWIEGVSGQDLLIGDHSSPFFDDPAEALPGNDVFLGQVGENDYDTEGGDDIMAQNAAIDRNAGAGGFDWAIHQYDTVGAIDDMMINNNLGALPIQ